MHEFQDRAEARDHATRGPVRQLATALGLGLALVGFALTGAACSGSGGSSSQSAGSGEEEDYPNLARVPGEQPRPTPASLRRDLIDGLAADRDNARYSVEPLTAQTAATPPAAPPPAAKPQVEIIWETLRVLPFLFLMMNSRPSHSTSPPLPLTMSRRER